MSLVVSQNGALRLLTWMLQTEQQIDENLQVRLFTNDLTITRDTVLADFTEATFLGYVRFNLLRGNWDTPAIIAGKPSVTYTPDISWIPQASGQTIYGYFVVSQFDFAYLWGERFNTPRTMVSGTPLVLTPRMSGVSEFP